MDLVDVATELKAAVSELTFGDPVTTVYNPLSYAWEPHVDYLRRFGRSGIEGLFVGMNPGPWGMAQTGVPFGEVAAARTWLEIAGTVGKPPDEHPKRPITGFDCQRSEVSGRRLWGWVAERFGSPGEFFERFFVWNYCPLVFMKESGANHTPDKLPAHERTPLFVACDRALRQVVDVLEPGMVIGVGAFAEQRANTALSDGVRVERILHPSPASPAANRGWAEQADRQLRAMGVSIPEPD